VAAPADRDRVRQVRPSGPARPEISATPDGGRSWTASPLGKPAWQFTLPEPAYIDTDLRHGWVAADVTQTPLSPAGVLFRTTDGGSSWQQLPMPASGPVAFTSPRAGRLVSDGQPGTRPAGQFYVTTDGGRAWHAETVTPRAGYRPAQAVYLMPAPAGPAPGAQAVAFGGSGTPAVMCFLPGRRQRRGGTPRRSSPGWAAWSHPEAPTWHT
jgi:photosystem II stability/assembly factor-like uncharacterized protein